MIGYSENRLKHDHSLLKCVLNMGSGAPIDIYSRGYVDENPHLSPA